MPTTLKTLPSQWNCRGVGTGKKYFPPCVSGGPGVAAYQSRSSRADKSATFLIGFTSASLKKESQSEWDS
jgi:hypothetical protein